AFARYFFKDAVVRPQDGHVKRAAAEVVDEDRLFGVRIEAVTDGRGGWLVDQRQHLQATGGGTKLGRVPGEALRVRRDGNDRLLDRLPQHRFGVALHEGEKHD